MLHGSETWLVRKENVVALQRGEMRIVRWMCGIKLKDRLPSKELRERLGIDDCEVVRHFPVLHFQVVHFQSPLYNRQLIKKTQ